MRQFFYVLYLGPLLHKQVLIKVKVPKIDVQVPKYRSEFPSMVITHTVCPTDIGPTSQPVLVYVLKKTRNVDKKTT